MCGIFLYSDFDAKTISLDKIYENFQKIRSRGPDSTRVVIHNDNFIGFHRLAINDISGDAQQPFFSGDNFLICNGEIYNHGYLEKKWGITTRSRSDCECLLTVVEQDDIASIDGVFAIICRIGDYIYLIRDRIGVRPLFYTTDDFRIIAGSEPKCLVFGLPIQELPPACILRYDLKDSTYIMKSYYSSPLVARHQELTEEYIVSAVRSLLLAAVKKRMMSNRKIGCLLSGGLDSSIICALVQKFSNEKINTFSIGFSDSTDIKYARIMSRHIKSHHNEYIISYEYALSRIPEIVKGLATYDITTIRASTPMWLLCEWINNSFSDRVLFSGEGSDEVFSGYLYFHLAPDNQELEKESKRLVDNLYKYDVLRADRCISCNGLELREPFLDRDLIDFYLTIPGEFRRPKDGYEKWILRKAFQDILPESICWRRKAAFSDAVSSSEKPWYRYIQEWCDKNITIPANMRDRFKTTESYYYYKIFSETYPTYKPDIEYWLPKWQDVGVEPSATKLSIFDKTEH